MKKKKKKDEGEKKAGGRGITNRKSRGRTIEETDVRLRACYLTRSLLKPFCLHVECNKSYLTVEEGKTITHNAATRASTKKENLCMLCCTDDSD